MTERVRDNITAAALRPSLLPAALAGEPAAEVRVQRASNPLPEGTLGDLGLAARVVGRTEFRPTTLILPFDRRALTGLDPASVRAFRFDTASRSLQPVWSSGLNLDFGFVWAEIARPGVYVPIGLPRDRLLQDLLRTLARERSYNDTSSPERMEELTRRVLAPFLEAPQEELDALRRLLATLEAQTALVPLSPLEIRLGKGGHLDPLPLPRDTAPEEFRRRLAALKLSSGRLPEEALFNPPEQIARPSPPWPLPSTMRWEGIDPRLLEGLHLRPDLIRPFPLCWFFSQDWWMYHHDEEHSGGASGCSDITSTSASRLVLLATVPVDGPVITIPCVVQGKVYVGTGNSSTDAGTLYKIDLGTGNIDGQFPTFGTAFYPFRGIGGSPAIAGGRVYFTGVHGKVYCVDAATLSSIPPFPPALWITDLKTPSQAQNQPVTNPNGDCWSSPLVVNGKVYIGCGEGEGGAFGFVYCLEAASGRVIWLFCTNQFTAAADNNPNVIPQSAVPGGLPGWATAFGFTIHADPPHRGASIWSSLAYDAGSNRVFVGTGNSANGLPDARYGSGALALDADTGAFQGFFQPDAADSYYPEDSDVDISSSPTLFTRGGTRVLGIGSKNGAYFLLDARSTPALAVLARRQLLPKDAMTNNQLPNVDPGGAAGGENFYGIFGTGAVHHGLGRLFIGVGGYGGAIDFQTTPFMRAVDWNTLNDAWTTAVTSVGANQVARYTVPIPPMYTNPGECGLSSPAVVNDLVFVSTSKPALYALKAQTGLCVWRAPGLDTLPAGSYALGPAIYGNYVILGCADTVKIYHLRPPWCWPWCWPWPIPPWWEIPWWRQPPPPPPPPDPFGQWRTPETPGPQPVPRPPAPG